MMMMRVGGGSTWTRATRFKTLLNAQTAKHVPGKIEMSATEMAEKFSKGVKIPDNGSDAFICNNGYYYAYFDKDQRMLVVTKLK